MSQQCGGREGSLGWVWDGKASTRLGWRGPNPLWLPWNQERKAKQTFPPSSVGCVVTEFWQQRDWLWPLLTWGQLKFNLIGLLSLTLLTPEWGGADPAGNHRPRQTQ